VKPVTHHVMHQEYNILPFRSDSVLCNVKNTVQCKSVLTALCIMHMYVKEFSCSSTTLFQLHF